MLATVVAELAGVELDDASVFGVFLKLLKIRDHTSLSLVTNLRTFSAAPPDTLVFCLPG